LANLTVSVPEEMKARMDNHPEINWSEVARQCFASKLQEYERGEEKGEYVKMLERALSPIDEKIETEIKSVKEAEIARFTKRWGKPTGQFDVNEKPFVFLSKKFSLVPLTGKVKAIEVANHKDSEKLYTWSNPNLDAWNRDMKSIIEAFQSIGFAVGERELTSDDVQVYLFPDQTKGQARENTRNLLQRYAIFGLFAFDEEDIAYLGHREEKRK